jgi:hypothetical protein
LRKYSSSTSGFVSRMSAAPTSGTPASGARAQPSAGVSTSKRLFTSCSVARIRWFFVHAW